MTTIEFNKNIILNLGSLKRLAYKYTVNQDDADDLFQDTIYKALKYKTKFKMNTNFAGWLYTIMRNTFINNYRRKTKVLMVGDTTNEDFLLNSSSENRPSLPINELYYTELQELVNELQEEYRTPFQLFVEGYKYDEIKDQLGLPLGTVKSRIFTARKKMAEKVNSNE